MFDDEANTQIAIALRLDPESWEVNREAARLVFRQSRFVDAIPYFSKAVALMETDYANGLMLLSSYSAIGDEIGAVRAARLTIERAEKAVARDPINGAALAAGANALAVLGEQQRATEWIDRALLVAPDNLTMRYNLGCLYSAHLEDVDSALEVLGPFFKAIQSLSHLSHADVDPDLQLCRQHAQFQAMVADAKRRLKTNASSISAQAEYAGETQGKSLS